MMRAAILVLLAVSSAAQALPTDRERNDSIFEAGRARYFQALVRARHCEAALPDQTRALNLRYDAAIKALAEVYGKIVLESAANAVPDDRNLQSMCSGTLMSFDDKVSQIEQRARQGTQ